MCKAKVIGYRRISTDTQDNANQGPAIESYAAQQGLAITGWIDAQVSSRKSVEDRKIEETLASLGRGDHLIVVELSRLGRSIFEGVDIIRRLRERGVTVHGIRDNVRTNGKGDAEGDLRISLQFFFAQTERERISQRTKAALAAKRDQLAAEGKGYQGKGLGNPKLSEVHAKQDQEAADYAETVRPILAELVEQGLSQRAILDRLNQQGVKTVKGNAWALPYLQRTLKRLGLATVSKRGGKRS